MIVFIFLILDSRFVINRSGVRIRAGGIIELNYKVFIHIEVNTQIDNVTTHDTDLMFWMHAGSTYQGGSNSTTLRPNVNANRGNGASSIFASTNNFIEITGIQMEVGSAATDFEHLSFGEEFNLCKRYFQTLGYQYGDTIGGTNNYNGAIDAPILSTESGYSYYGGSQYPIQMREQPTITDRSLSRYFLLMR